MWKEKLETFFQLPTVEKRQEKISKTLEKFSEAIKPIAKNIKVNNLSSEINLSVEVNRTYLAALENDLFHIRITFNEELLIAIDLDDKSFNRLHAIPEDEDLKDLRDQFPMKNTYHFKDNLSFADYDKDEEILLIKITDLFITAIQNWMKRLHEKNK